MCTRMEWAIFLAKLVPYSLWNQTDPFSCLQDANFPEDFISFHLLLLHLFSVSNSKGGLISAG